MHIPEQLINFMNPVLMGVLFMFLGYGYFRGFLLQVYGLFNTIVKLIIAYLFAPLLAHVFTLYSPHINRMNNVLVHTIFTEKINTILWFFIIFVTLSVVLLVLKPLLKGFEQIPILKTVNKITGAALGLIKYVIFIVVLMMVLASPLIPNGRDAIDQSWLLEVETHAPTIMNKVYAYAFSHPAFQRFMAGEVLSERDKQALETWLQQQKYEENVIQQILEELSN